MGGLRKILLTAAFAVSGLVQAPPGQADDAGECSRDALALARLGRAFDACRRLAALGVPLAEYNLGEMYNRGLGVPRDFAEGSVWLRRAADQGFAPAQASLGRMFQQGQGMPANPAAAADWYRKAAEQGYAEAQYSLGLAYAQGSGVSLDPVLAYMWLSLAADAEAGAAADRDALARGMSASEIEMGRHLAREWKPGAP